MARISLGAAQPGFGNRRVSRMMPRATALRMSSVTLTSAFFVGLRLKGSSFWFTYTYVYIHI